jgi:ELP3 family radical SAM enzyme/protein acetyltransferase
MDDIEDIINKCGKSKAREQYNELISKGVSRNFDVEFRLKTKKSRSNSGVLVITVVLAPSQFSCSNDCHYCPNQPGTARSYLDNEPAVARGKSVGYDAFEQVVKRLSMLGKNGHTLQKLEIIVLGGTFSDYPRKYQEEFLRDVFFAANTYGTELRDRKSILEEQLINENTVYKIIGISLETRPDKITKHELMRFRKLGCTRVQIGVQHTSNEILSIVNRGHTVEQSVRAIKLLRNYGFKVDVHVMPDLPGTTPELDKVMLQTVLTHSDFKPDYLKIYPCLDVEYTEIRKWKQSGKWNPYAESDDGSLIIDVCLHAKIHSQYYTRFNRIQRDFCEENIEKDVKGYNSQNIRSNFRQILQNEAKKKNITCKCIRCCEVGSKSFDSYYIHIDKYVASSGVEYFICAANNDRTILYGFVRLRLSGENYRGYALIRELHVYGTICNFTDANVSATQHKGIGTLLMIFAQFYATLNGYKTISVISGVGVRNFYRKLHYKYNTDGYYMTKTTNVIFCFFQLIYYCIAHIFQKKLLIF